MLPQEVIDLGAVHLVIPGNFPIGCAPSYLALFQTPDPSAYDDIGCLKDYNALATYHNDQLQSGLQMLRQAFPQRTIMYADYYEAAMHLLRHAAELGFDDSSLHKACCGTGGQYNFDLSAICGNPGTVACSDPSKYVSWDGIHLTQEAYRVMAESLIMQGFAYPSYNIQEHWNC